MGKKQCEEEMKVKKIEKEREEGGFEGRERKKRGSWRGESLRGNKGGKDWKMEKKHGKNKQGKRERRGVWRGDRGGRGEKRGKFVGE